MELMGMGLIALTISGSMVGSVLIVMRGIAQATFERREARVWAWASDPERSAVYAELMTASDADYENLIEMLDLRLEVHGA